MRIRFLRLMVLFGRTQLDDLREARDLFDAALRAASN